MKININESERIAEVWLTNSEKYNPILQEILKPLYKDYKEKKYKIALFYSGKGDLIDNTAGLLLHNKR